MRHNHGQFDDCKGPLRHDWDLVDVGKRNRSLGWTLVAYRCMRCGTEKLESYDVHGDLMNRSYKYPEGYKEEGRVPVNVYRLRLINKARRTKIKTYNTNRRK
jgi:hypothetical protein